MYLWFSKESESVTQYCITILKIVFGFLHFIFIAESKIGR